MKPPTRAQMDAARSVLIDLMQALVTDPPTVTIPEDQRWCWVGGDPLVMPWQFKRREAAALGAEVMRSGWLTRLVTADEWDAITARLARLDAIEALMRRIDAEDDDTECDRLWGELLRAIDGAS